MRQCVLHKENPYMLEVRCQVQVTISISRDDASAKTKDISLACQVSRPDTRQGRREMYTAMMGWLKDAAEEIGALVSVEPPTFDADSRAVE